MKKSKKASGAAGVPNDDRPEVVIKRSDYPHYARYYPITAHVDGKCVGEVFAYMITDRVLGGRDRCYIYVHGTRVDEAMRGCGIGRKLMEDLVALAKEHGCYKVVLAADRKRKAARALYQSMGFVPHGREFRLDL